MLRILDTNTNTLMKPRHRHRDNAAMPDSPRTLKFHTDKLLKEKRQLLEEPDRVYAYRLSVIIDEKLDLLDKIRKDILAYEERWLSRVEYALRPVPED